MSKSVESASDKLTIKGTAFFRKDTTSISPFYCSYLSQPYAKSEQRPDMEMLGWNSVIIPLIEELNLPRDSKIKYVINLNVTIEPLEVKEVETDDSD